MLQRSVEVIKAMSLIGIPTICAILCGVFKALTDQSKKIQILMDAQQAQMRRGLVQDYYSFKKAGEISQRDLDDWEAQYQAYHALGANGVLDSIRDDLFKIPRKEN